ncbi:hypothetical protein DVH24_003957, partial [Malus domestica]
ALKLVFGVHLYQTTTKEKTKQNSVPSKQTNAEYMEKESIDHGVESDGTRNKEKCETIEPLLSHVHKLTDKNKILRIHLGIHKDTTDHTITIHKNATDHTITRQNKPQFSRSKSMGPSFLGRLIGCSGT